jgi:hypothetical protein
MLPSTTVEESAMAKNKHRRSAFVPRMLLPAAAMVSVIPACALASCSGDVVTSSGTAASSGFFTVAAVAYPAYEAGLGGSSTTSTTAASSSSGMFGVAAVAYPAYEAGTD